MSVSFELEGQQYIAFNGGPKFSLTPAISLFVHCATQEEVDYYRGALTSGGEPAQCGWLKDKFGLTWQIVPNRLGELPGDEDREKANRVMKAMLKMVKLDVAGLQKVYDEG